MEHQGGMLLKSAPQVSIMMTLMHTSFPQRIHQAKLVRRLSEEKRAASRVSLPHHLHGASSCGVHPLDSPFRENDCLPEAEHDFGGAALKDWSRNAMKGWPNLGSGIDACLRVSRLGFDAVRVEVGLQNSEVATTNIQTVPFSNL